MTEVDYRTDAELQAESRRLRAAVDDRLTWMTFDEIKILVRHLDSTYFHGLPPTGASDVI